MGQRRYAKPRFGDLVASEASRERTLVEQAREQSAQGDVVVRLLEEQGRQLAYQSQVLCDLLRAVGETNRLLAELAAQRR